MIIAIKYISKGAYGRSVFILKFDDGTTKEVRTRNIKKYITQVHNYKISATVNRNILK